MEKLSLEQLGRVDVERYKALKKIKVTVLLDNIRSGHNVGAVFRTSDAFLIEQVVLTGITPVPPHREINKSAIGATQSVTWSYHKEAVPFIEHYRSMGYEIVGIEQTDKSIPLAENNIDPKGKYLLVFGNEVGGVSDEIIQMLDKAVEIPQFGTKHSLNISVCAGIVLWHWFNALKE